MTKFKTELLQTLITKTVLTLNVEMSVEDFTFYLQKRRNSKCVTLVVFFKNFIKSNTSYLVDSEFKLV